jgi:hypothetical protein
VATEIPTEFYAWSRVQWTHHSESDMESLMGAMPYTDPAVSWADLLPLREAVAECVDLLDEEDRFLVEAIWFERVTVRVLALRMGLEKSQTHRLCCRAVEHLGVLCAGHPLLAERYLAAS